MDTNTLVGAVAGSVLVILLNWGRSLYAGIVLVSVARKRREGIRIRNAGRRIPAGTDNLGWLAEAEGWEKSVPGLVKWLSISEAERIRDLDTVEREEPPGVTDATQLRLLRNLSATTKRLDSLLERHEPKW